MITESESSISCKMLLQRILPFVPCIADTDSDFVFFLAVSSRVCDLQSFLALELRIGSTLEFWLIHFKDSVYIFPVVR